METQNCVQELGSVETQETQKLYADNPPKKRGWGDLEPDRGGSHPKHVRRIRLQKFDPNATTAVANYGERKSPKDWSFFEQEDSVYIEQNAPILARKIYRPRDRIHVFHLGEMKDNGKHNRISFTSYEAKHLIPTMESVLIQVDEHKRRNLPDEEIIKFFKQPERAFEYDPNDKDKLTFWNSPDASSASVKMRWQFDGRLGRYMLGILNFVSQRSSDLYENDWPGYSIWLDTDSVLNLLEFIRGG